MRHPHRDGHNPSYGITTKEKSDQGSRLDPRPQSVYNDVGVVKNLSSTPLILRAGSGVKGGPSVFVGPFIARPLTLRTARYNRVRTKRSFVLTQDSFAASDQDSSP